MGDEIETLSFNGNPFVVRKRKRESKILKETAVSQGRIITVPKVVKEHSGLNDIKKILWILEDGRLYVKFGGEEKINP